ncbi:hypothetical protein PILCRDRAFT_817898 [Piloderma croceum F 1598]|uniref:Uncharacterized protein n=1 Tax=Piloderma croceum (strain F 1598) TaxID=765440 RepID=A0A0C3C5W5_PILCF|nr:hypothetical protein PILCRDRAFT_817898 [Piloderma croceum F 1598]
MLLQEKVQLKIAEYCSTKDRGSASTFRHGFPNRNQVSRSRVELNRNFLATPEDLGQ